MKSVFKRNILFHTILLPVFFVLHSWNNFNYLVKFKDIFTILFGILIFSFILLSIITFFLRNPKSAAALNFILISYMLFYGYIYDQLQHFIKLLSRHSMLISLFFILFIVGILILRKSKESHLQKLTSYLNILMLILCAYEMINTSLILNTYPKKGNTSNIDSATNRVLYPNIYILVFDEYASSKSLMRDYRYDNSSLDSFLIKNDFFLMKESKSNYLRTNLSIASLLNFGYTSGLSPRQGMTDYDLYKSLENIKSNRLFSLAKKNGYNIYNYSIFDTNESPSKVKNEYLFNNQRILLFHTMISRLINEVGPNVKFSFLRKILGTEITPENYRRYNERTENLFLKDISLQNSEVPILAYAHFLMPHPPFLYDATLKPVYYNEQELENYYSKKFIPNYLNYLTYTNEHLKAIVTATLKENNNNCIIFVLGDHGYKITDDSTLTSDHFFNNLQALYLPSKKYAPLKSNSTPVNVMRHIINQSFTQRLPFLKDSSILIGTKW